MADGTAQEIGVAYVSVVPSTRGFTGELRRQLAPEVATAGRASADDFAGGFAQNLGALKAVAAGAGAATAAAFATESVKAFAEADKAQTELQRTLERFPQLADTNIERLNDLNRAMQRKAAIDGDSLAAADAVLARFGLTGQEIEKLTPLLVDYAAASGKDAESAAAALGKALLGNTRALKEVGVNFTATGNRARDLETIMAALEQRVGGAGEAFRASAAGGLRAFDLAVEDTKEAVGEALVPVLDQAVTAMQGVADIAPNIVGSFTLLSTATRGLTTDLGQVQGPLANVIRLLGMPEVQSIFTGTLLGGPAGAANAVFSLFTDGVSETERRLTALGFKVDETTGKWVSSKLANQAFAAANLSATPTIDEMEAAMAKYLATLTPAQRVQAQLTGEVETSGVAFTNAYGPAAAYVAMIERLGNFTLSDDAKRALDATMPTDEENRGRALDAAVAGRARRGDGTLTEAERNYWTDRAKAAEVARKAAADAAQKAAEERARLAKQALEAARREAEARRQEIAAFVKGVQDEITRYGAITQFQPRGLFAPTVSTITADMRARVAKARAFFPLVARLSRLGLNRTSLLEIIQAGPTAGTEIAQALLAGGARSVREVNALEAQLKSAGASIAGVASAAQFGGQATANVSVAVYIGNEQLDGHIDTRIAANTRTTQQAARRGTRF